MCKLSNLGNRIILGQDKQVVLTQQPKKTDMAMGEKLFQADRPIVAYRQRRKELIEEARGAGRAENRVVVRPAYVNCRVWRLPLPQHHCLPGVRHPRRGLRGRGETAAGGHSGQAGWLRPQPETSQDNSSPAVTAYRRERPFFSLPVMQLAPGRFPAPSGIGHATV